MTKVATDYEVSDVVLKKICDKHRVPITVWGAGQRRLPARKSNKLTSVKYCSSHQ